MKLSFLFLSIFISIEVLYARTPKIYTHYYKVTKETNIEYLLRKDLKLPSSLLDEQKYLTNIKRWNQAINSSLNLNQLKPGDKVYIEVPYKYKKNFKLVTRRKQVRTAKKKVKKLLKKRKPASVKKLNKKIETKPIVNNDLSLSIFYAASQGSFNESIKGTDVSAQTTQDSPATIGINFVKNNKSDPSSFNSGSFYISYLNNATSSISNEQVNIPLEYGSNFYWNFKTETSLIYYSGFDIERFSTFNIDEVVSGEDLSTREHTMSYLTIGLQNMFQVFSQSFLYKFSISQSILSQSNKQNETNDILYNGNKFILFLAAPISRNIAITSFYKQHILNGPTELSISRIGIGLSYKFR